MNGHVVFGVDGVADGINLRLFGCEYVYYSVVLTYYCISYHDANHNAMEREERKRNKQYR